MQNTMISNTKTNSENLISSRYWNQVLHLLGAALFTDGTPSKDKMNTFLDVVIELKFVIDPTVKIRRQTLRAWYKLNSNKLNAIDILKDDSFLTPLLKEVHIYGHKIDILTSMVQIVIADGVYSAASQALTRKTILLWYIPSNHMDDINYICSDLIGSSSKPGERVKVH